uniref:Dynein heavy chain ATP-binding dynein motor region domain-containing protein n=1 Tax=Strigamia maritima TaxID=126957 RepID=T1J5R4_STRMM
MPSVENYGAQPPIELLRTYMDFHGWYDRKAIGSFRTLVDVNLICAMGPPGGGRNSITPRFLRHFNYLSYTDLENASMKRIFGTILGSWLDPATEIFKAIGKLVDSSITVYNTIIDKLLPTPAKSHYTFNLRDLSKMFQGMLMFSHVAITGIQSLLRIWYHENCRVYQDRLINNEDRFWFQKLMDDRMRDDFDVPFDVVVIREPVLYADFLSKNPDHKLYEEVTDMDKLVRYLEEALDDYNQNDLGQMNLVLFNDAIKHICRIGRVIRQPGGNALLLGMQGNGRQSLTRLASHVNEMECFQIELVKGYEFIEWRDDLKKVILKSGLRKRKMVFLFSDTQIKLESFLEDVNSILNSGNVPNIFPSDEMETIYQGMRQVTIDAGLPAIKSNMYAMLTKCVKSNLHSVITMSPIGEVFRERLRQFPAFVTCCTINWFSEWPEAALQSVALIFLKQIPNLVASNQVINGTIAMCQLMHQTVGDAAVRFHQELLRRVYVTPKGYMDLLSSFRKIHSIKISELTSAKDRMNTGLEKLKNCSRDVAQMQIDLEILRPQLVIAAKDTEIMMIQIAFDTELAEETRVVVKQEEEQASKKAAETQAIADDAQKDLDQALPALDAALASLKNLNKGDVVELRTMQSPPQGVRMVMEAVCILKGIKPKTYPGQKPGSRIIDYWDPGKALLQDPTRFLDNLFKFDKENISDETMKKVRPYIEDPTFLPEHIAKVSKACTSICEWARAMYKYAEITRIVEPKRIALAGTKADLAVTMEALAEAKGRLDAVENGLSNLNGKLSSAINRKKELEDNSVLCEARLIRAAKLIDGLKDERSRWQETVESLENKLNSILGDVLISSGSVAYLGPFTEEYRSSLSHEWIKGLDFNGVPHTSDPTFLNTMGDPVKIRTWQIAGLPKDRVSVQNGLIAEYNERWPLFIDPQGQANKWIKNLNKESGLLVFKMSEKDISKILEKAVLYGMAALLEKLGEELDPVLDPVLLNQVFYKGQTLMMKIGDNLIKYHEDFRFYMTTSYPNPNFSPEVSLKATVLNFTLAPSGLEDQLLATVVAEERQDLEIAKNELIVNNAQMKQDLKNLEDQLLFRLSSSEGNPVDDVEFIELLEASKKKSAEIKKKVAAAEITEKIIDETRSQYIPVAVRAQILFFCMSGLAVIDPMYQYSLEWFQALYTTCIRDSEKSGICYSMVD